MAANFQELMLEMMKNPPDPNEALPTSNRKDTMYGATIPFHVISWVVAFARLYARFKIVREPGWDDYVIILAALFNLISMISFLGAIHTGVGKHLVHIPSDEIMTTFKWLYVQSASYYTTTALIKVSLLLQYLRLFRNGILRKICLILLILVSLWGSAFIFMAWFPCFPVSGFWNRSQGNVKCYGFGFGSVNGAYITFVSFAATNMFFDTIIFLIPMAEYLKPSLHRKQILALTGLFTLGSVVVLMSILRLWTALKHKSDNVQSLDFTWWYPLTLIISCLEVDFAIMCASMPIFWPIVVASLAQIFVTKEVHVTTHHRLDDNTLEYEMDRPTSLKSNNSQEGLTRMTVVPKTDYRDQFVKDHVTGKGIVDVAVDGKGQGKWKSLGS